MSSTLDVGERTSAEPLAYDDQFEAEPADPEYLIGEVRLQTAKPFHLFHVSWETTLEKLPASFDEHMPALFSARDSEGLLCAGPIVVIYSGSHEHRGDLTVQAGMPVSDRTRPAGRAEVRAVEETRVASLIYCGSLDHIGRAYSALQEQVARRGLKAGDCREWYLYFEHDHSSNNVLQIQLEVRDR